MIGEKREGEWDEIERGWGEREKTRGEREKHLLCAVTNLLVVPESQ